MSGNLGDLLNTVEVWTVGAYGGVREGGSVGLWMDPAVAADRTDWWRFT